MQSYTADETFKFTQDLLTANPDMRGLFIQTDQPAHRRAAGHQGRRDATASCWSRPSTASPNSSTC